jgi:hypothetical protein
VLDLPHGTTTNDFVLNQVGGPLEIGINIINLTQSPQNPAHILASKQIEYSAADWPVPFDNSTATKTIYYMPAAPQGAFQTMSAMKASNGTIRVVWVESAGTVANNTPDAVYYTNDTGSGPSLNGPLHCNASVCASPVRLDEAVADPTSPNSVIAICEGANMTTSVVRFAATGTCDVLVDGTQLTSLVPVRLALRMN